MTAHSGNMNMQPPAMAVGLPEMIRAAEIIRPYHRPTPLCRYENLSRLLGAEVYVKHENHNPTGTFKIRGGLHAMHHLREAGVEGVITYSTGNHGTSVATAAGMFGLHAVVVVPENSNPLKMQAIREAGAELVVAGATFEESGLTVEALVRERGLYHVHPANEPIIINGVGTEFLEIYQELPEIDVMILPLGAGSEVAAAITAFKALRPKTEVIAVQAEAACAAWRSWRSGRIVTDTVATFAGGVATGSAYELPFGIYRDGLADFVVLTEDELYEGIALAAHHTRNFVEGAGGSCLRAAFKLQDRLAGKKVVIQFSGANAAAGEAREALGRACFASGMPV